MGCINHNVWHGRVSVIYLLSVRYPREIKPGGYLFNSPRTILKTRKKLTSVDSQCITLRQKSSIYPKFHILKISIFSKFTYLKSYFSQKSIFQNLNFHKIRNFKMLFFTKFTFSKCLFFTKFTFMELYFSQNSHFQNLIFHKIHISKP